MSILIDESTRILVLGITGREAVSFTRDTLDYGGQVVAGVTPGRGGRDVHGVPVYDSVREAAASHEPNAAVIAVPPRALRDAAFECIAYGIPLVVIVTERVPRLDAAQVVELAAREGVRVIGPNSMGLISPGKTKVGSVGGPAADTTRQLRARERRHHVALGRDDDRRSRACWRRTASASPRRSRSAATRSRDRRSRACSPSSRRTRRRRRVVTFSEPGGAMEAELVELIGEHGSRLRIVSFIAGNFMAEMPGVRFGHAGALVQRDEDSAAAKASMLREAGVRVADALAEIPALVRG